jgi:hypothetical protein
VSAAAVEVVEVSIWRRAAYEIVRVSMMQVWDVTPWRMPWIVEGKFLVPVKTGTCYWVRYQEICVPPSGIPNKGLYLSALGHRGLK